MAGINSSSPIAITLVALVAVFLSMTTSVTPTASAQPSSDSWTTYPLGGLDGTVYAWLVDSDGVVYAGGDFLYADGEWVGGVARWDGDSWSALAGGINGRIYSLARGPGGFLYAGGTFSSAGDSPASNIAMWDGNQWHPLDQGTNGEVLALETGPDGELFVGGTFSQAEGQSVWHIAMWDGSDWTGLGQGMNPGGHVHALALAPDGTLFAGGRFTSAGGINASRVARWDGSSWSPLGSGIQGTDTHAVFSLAIDAAGGLIAAGRFNGAGGTVTPALARWNGTSWGALGEVLQPEPWAGLEVYVVAASADGSVYAGGQFSVGGSSDVARLAKWTGTSWEAVGPGISIGPRALAAKGQDLYVGGEGFEFGELSAPYAARWSGESWHALGALTSTGIAGEVEALAVGPDGNLFAAGAFHSAGNVPARRVAVLNDGEWQALGEGIRPHQSWGSVRALAIGQDGTVYASSGWYWKGEEWAILGGGLTDGATRALHVASDGSLYAGGTFTIAGGSPASRVARWNGQQWTALGTGMNGAVAGFAEDGTGNIYAVGSFSQAGGTAADRVAVWNGTEWSPVGGSPGTASIGTIAIDSHGTVYVGAQQPGRVLRLGDGGQWTVIGTFDPDEGWLFASLDAISVDVSGNLYAAGRFTGVDGLAAANVAVFDGETWAPLDKGINGWARALAISDEMVWIGGYFQGAGGEASSRIAQWDGAKPVSIATEPSGAGFELDAAYPNPLGSQATVTFTLSQSAAARIEIFDLLGRRVALLLDELLEAGTHNSVFDASSLSNGIYVLRLTAGGESQTRLVTVAR
jgi:hypothetical protein